jgi:4-cresol dehydrogenase (hydroxylating) flavoprotein subunit
LGIHLTPAPEHYMTCEVSVPKEEDLPFLIGTISDLMRRNIIQNSPSVSNVLRQCFFNRDPKVAELISPYFGKGCIPENALAEAQKLMGCGFWKAQFALYGPVEIVQASWRSIESKFSKLQGTILWKKEATDRAGEFLTTTDVGPEEIPHSGIPTLDPLQLLGYRGPGGGHTCFSPILPPSGRELYAWYLTAKQRTIDAGFDFFADFHVYARYVIAIELVVFAPAEGKRCDALYRHLLEDAVQQGYSEYRTHVDYMDTIASHFDFNKGALRKYVQVLKDVFDPNGIISPGKSGIWNSSKGDSKTNL